MTQLRQRVERLETAATTSTQYGATSNDLANFPGMMNLVAGSGVSFTPGTGTLTITATGGGGTVTSVGMSVPSFLSVSGSPVTTSGTLAVTYSGTALPIANGGSGQTTANAALNAFLPSQATHSGKVLQTDGTNTSWQTNGSGTVTSVGVSTGSSGVSVTGSPVTTSGTIDLDLGTLANVDDAPSDGTTYGRKDGAWAATGGGGGVALMLGGTGEDGDVDLDGANTFSWATKSGNVYTLTRTPFIARLRITTGCELRTASRPIWAQEWDVTTGFYGIITSNGTSGASIVAPAGGGGSGGAAATANGQYYPSGTAAAGTGGTAGVFTGNSNASSNVANISASIGGQGSRGGQGGAGSTGTPGTPGTMGTFAQFQSTGVSPFAPLGGAFGLTTSSTSGGPGTGGTGGTGTGGGTAGGGGGGAGSGGAGIDLMIGEIVTDATTPAALVRARGGNGGNGSDYTSNTTGDKGGGGGGGAGGGGGIRIICGLLTGPAVTGFADASGGNGGNGGTGVNAGNPGNGAAGGNGGQIRIYNLTAGTVSVTNGASGAAAAGATGGAGGACIADLA